MEQQQSFSPGLLYSVAPENFAQLHLQEEASADAVDWEERESECAGDTFSQSIISFLKITAAKWGATKL